MVVLLLPLSPQNSSKFNMLEISFIMAWRGGMGFQCNRFSILYIDDT